MSFRLITGRAERDHVTSDDMGWLYALTMGDGRYMLEDQAGTEAMRCTVIDTNTVHVTQGHLLIDGRHFRNGTEGENLAIANGSQGLNRIDLIVCRYRFETFGEDYLEHGELVVIQGDSVAGEPERPAHTEGSILNGDRIVEVPLFEVPINGLAIGEPSECLLDGYELPAKYGGTGVAVEIITTVRGAIEDARAAAAAANAAARHVESVQGESPTTENFEQLCIQLAAKLDDYLVVGETVFIPNTKASYSGNEVTFYNATADDEGVITLL